MHGEHASVQHVRAAERQRYFDVPGTLRGASVVPDQRSATVHPDPAAAAVQLRLHEIVLLVLNGVDCVTGISRSSRCAHMDAHASIMYFTRYVGDVEVKTCVQHITYFFYAASMEIHLSVQGNAVECRISDLGSLISDL